MIGLIAVNDALPCKTNGKKFSELTESAAMGFTMVCVILQAVRGLFGKFVEFGHKMFKYL